MTPELYQDNWRGSEEEREREWTLQGGSIFQAEGKAKVRSVCLVHWGTARRPAGTPLSEGWKEKETEDTGARSHRKCSMVKNHFCFFTLLQINYFIKYN